MKAWHVALILAYAASCLAGAYAYTQWGAARLAEKTAEEYRAENIRKVAEIEGLRDAAKRTEKATATASEESKKVVLAHDERVEKVRETSSTSRGWMLEPVPDGLRDLFCAGNPNGAVDPAGITSNPVHAADAAGNHNE